MGVLEFTLSVLSGLAILEFLSGAPSSVIKTWINRGSDPKLLERVTQLEEEVADLKELPGRVETLETIAIDGENLSDWIKALET